jgi:hypothetical protein
MHQVETVLWLERGGVIRGVVAGVVLGALVSVLPVLMGLVFGGVPLIIATAFVLHGLWRRRLPLALIAGWGAFVTVVALAIAAPTKFEDKRVPHTLYATRLTVEELARELDIHAENPSHVVVTLPSAQPTWRELRAALAEVGLTLEIGYCGTSDSLLFGAYPMDISVEG